MTSAVALEYGPRKEQAKHLHWGCKPTCVRLSVEPFPNTKRTRRAHRQRHPALDATQDCSLDLACKAKQHGQDKRKRSLGSMLHATSPDDGQVSQHYLARWPHAAGVSSAAGSPRMAGFGALWLAMRNLKLVLVASKFAGLAVAPWGGPAHANL